MGKQSKVVDLVANGDGSYSPKKSKSKSVATRPIHKRTDKEKPKYVLSRDADEFLAGIDVGLDLVEAVSMRVGRFLKLRS